jgi:hypothetical protein
MTFCLFNLVGRSSEWLIRSLETTSQKAKIDQLLSSNEVDVPEGSSGVDTSSLVFSTGSPCASGAWL